MEHFTPVLKSVYRPPVCQRMEFKILLLVYKCSRGLSTSLIYTHVSSQRGEAAPSFLFSPPVAKAFRLPEVCSYCQSYLDEFLRLEIQIL